MIKANKDEAFALGLKHKLRGGDLRLERMALDVYADAFSEVKLPTKSVEVVIDAEVGAGQYGRRSRYRRFSTGALSIKLTKNWV